jgi:hypothetical protein
MARQYDYTNPRDRVVQAGEPVDNSVTTTSLPSDFTKEFAAKIRKFNIRPDNNPFGIFGNEQRDEYIREKEPLLADGEWNSGDINKVTRAADFSRKYISSLLVNKEEKVGPETALSYLTKDPNQGLNNTFGYPGGMEVS